MPSSPPFDARQALRFATGALAGRISIPLSAIRGRLGAISEKVSLTVEAASPGLRLEGKAHALGAPIEFSVRIDAEGVRVEGEQRTVRIRLSEVELATTDDAPGPLADAIRTGMIDTQHPATLIGNMVALPDMVVAAEGQDVVIDLMKIPAIERDELLKATLAAATSYLGVTGIRASNDTLELQLGLLPGGVKEAALSTARAALTPAVRFLWPERAPR
ncbi:MAG: hypothetical protein HKP36_14000 [Myxococcales bacterium]|nr:hypothetical protein [Deltaproteobacteria bacterium]NNL25553.1 hypothetical protein [Myxococcales bacterium]RZV52133.1 MAG: hypothetical protein EX268_12800 [Deltaproteobacteria bacterium]